MIIKLGEDESHIPPLVALRRVCKVRCDLQVPVVIQLKRIYHPPIVALSFTIAGRSEAGPVTDIS